MAEGIVERYQFKGYTYNRVTEDWKRACQALPCSGLLHWPKYRTAVRTFEKDGKSYKVQLWKGYCQKYFNDVTFPGGYGAEVGLYNDTRAAWIPTVPAPFKIRFEMRYKESGLRKNKMHNFGPMADSPEKTYWQTQWMEVESYNKYLKTIEWSAPYVWNMDLYYWIDDVEQPVWPGYGAP